MIRYDVERPGRTDTSISRVDRLEAEDWVLEDGILVFYVNGKKSIVYNKYEWKKLTRVG